MPFELVENGKIIKTDKCNATDFADFVQKLNDCNHAAESIVDEAILKGTNVSKAICQSFTEKVEAALHDVNPINLLKFVLLVWMFRQHWPRMLRRRKTSG